MAEIVGTNDTDALNGTSLADLVRGRGGNDILKGLSGADVLRGSAGDDRLEGGEGADTLNGASGTDTLLGGAGDDILNGGLGADVLSGGDGADVMHGGAGDDSLDGGAGDDRLVAGAGSDTLTGGEGADTFIVDWADIAAGERNVITDLDFGSGDILLIRGANEAQVRIESAEDLALAVSTGNAPAITLDGTDVVIEAGNPVDPAYENLTVMRKQPSMPRFLTDDGETLFTEGDVFSASADGTVTVRRGELPRSVVVENASTGEATVLEGVAGASLSADGSTLFFQSDFTAYAPDPFDDVYTDLITFDIAGGTFTNITAGTEAFVQYADWSADGSVVAFVTDDGNETGLYLYVRESGLTTELLADRSVGYPNIDVSRDGSTVVLDLCCLEYEVVVYDVDSGLSASLNQGQFEYAYDPTVSADGRFVLFGVEEFGRGGREFRVFDRATNKTIDVTPNANGNSYLAVLSQNGSTVAFQTLATNLVPGDANGVFDVLLFDVETEIHTGVSTISEAGGRSPLLSFDGSVVAFASAGTEFANLDLNGQTDAILFFA